MPRVHISKVHARHRTWETETVCGRQMADVQMADRPAAITCGVCLAHMALWSPTYAA